MKAHIAFAAVLLALAATGCATCQQHPVACGIGTAVLVGSIAASAGAGSRGDGPDADIRHTPRRK